MKKITTFTFFLLFVAFLRAQSTTGFEEIGLGPESYRDGRDSADAALNGFRCGKLFLTNNFDTSFGGFWSAGFAISNKTSADTASTTNGFSKLYNAVTGSGFNGSPNYAIGTQQAIIRLTDSIEKTVKGFYLTNSNYAFLSMRWGDVFARQFTDSDYFRVRIHGYLNGQRKDSSVLFYLATGTGLIRSWEWVNTAQIGMVDSLQFTIESTDTSAWGLNTPAYFCIDDIQTTSLIATATEFVSHPTIQLLVYPNPSSDQLHIAADGDLLSAELFQVNGQKLIETDQPNLNVAHLGNGMYVLRVITTQGVGITKLTKAD